MRQVVLLSLFFIGYLAFGYQVENLNVRGQDKAQIEVLGQLPKESPSWKVQDNVLELSWPNTKLAAKLGEKLELTAPHALLKRVTLVQGAHDTVKGRIVINGSLEGIKDRIKFISSESGISVAIEYPLQNATTMKLLQEEQTPISASALSQKTENASGYRTVFGVIALFLLFCFVGGFGFYRYLKGKGNFRGARRYLIEQLSYCPIGAKSGVSLLKIGREFVLVGITPNQISMLSQLPKLQEQYEEEAGFERGVFQEAVAEEVQRLS